MVRVHRGAFEDPPLAHARGFFLHRHRGVSVGEKHLERKLGSILALISTVEQCDPIQPDEIILRRVPEDQMDGSDPRRPLPDAFDPHRVNDVDGLSVYREKYHIAAEVAGLRTRGSKPTWVARLRARSITDLGLTLKPDPKESEGGLPARPGHALIVEMNTGARKSDAVEQWKRQLLEKIINVEGGDAGFPAPAAAPAAPSSD